MTATTDMIVAIGGPGGVLVTLGAGLRVVYTKVEKRFDKLAADSKDRLAAIEAELDNCTLRERVAQKRNAVHITVIEILWLEVKRSAGGGLNEALDRAKKLLDDLKSDLPPDDVELTALALRLNPPRR